MFEAKYFMDEDVVLVTIDHRLGALGDHLYSLMNLKYVREDQYKPWH